MKHDIVIIEYELGSVRRLKYVSLTQVRLGA